MKTYFQGLNEIRFFAAFAVIVGHIEFIKSLYLLPNLQHLPFFSNTSGHIGVILFFVLSGFLITYLLLEEKEKTGISIFKFYIRRILRIWPLYFLVVVLTCFILPALFNYKGDDFYNTGFLELLNYTKYFLLILPNFGKVAGNYVAGADHLWSIGVEEQFYLIWPLLIFLLPISRKLLLFLFLFFIGVTILPNLLDYIKFNYVESYDNQALIKVIVKNLAHIKINCMALGAIMAYLLFTKNSILKLFYNKYVYILLSLITLYFWLSGFNLSYYTEELYSILFSVIILNVASNPTKLKIQNKALNYLGTISYGLYVYHWIIIVGIIEFSLLIGMKFNNIYENIALYILAIGLTIFTSALSYKYFESPILKLKKHFN